MLSILTYDAPKLVAALRSGYFRRAGVLVTVATSAHELLERAAILRPNVIIFVGGVLDPLGEREVARRLRAELADRHALLLLALPPERTDLDADLGFFDGIVALDEPATDLARLLGPLVQQSRRTQVRVPVRVGIGVLAAGDAPIEGSTVDFSAAGAGLYLARAPAADPYHVRFAREDGRRVQLGARACWQLPGAGESVRLGVRFVGATLDAVRTLYDLAFWEIGSDEVRLHGEVSERTSFAGVELAMKRARAIDLADVSRVSSAGVLRWLDFLRKVTARQLLHLRRVSVPVAQKMLLVPAMTRRCLIESFYMPFECDECDLEALELVTPGSLLVPACPECGMSMWPCQPLQKLRDVRTLSLWN